MLPLILGGIGAAAGIASKLTQKPPTVEYTAMGSDGTMGAGAIASRRFAEDRVDRTGLGTQIANNDIANNAKAFEQNALMQGNLANQKAQKAIGQMKRQVNEGGATSGMSAAQRAGVNNSLSQGLSGMLQQNAQTSAQTGQQIAGMQMNAAQQQLGNTMNEKGFDQSRLPQISWDKQIKPADNTLSDVLGMVSELGGAAAGGAFGDLGGILGGAAEGIRSDPSLASSMASAPPQASLKIPETSGLLAQQNAGMKPPSASQIPPPPMMSTGAPPFGAALANESNKIESLRQMGNVGSSPVPPPSISTVKPTLPAPSQNSAIQQPKIAMPQMPAPQMPQVKAGLKEPEIKVNGTPISQWQAPEVQGEENWYSKGIFSANANELESRDFGEAMKMNNFKLANPNDWEQKLKANGRAYKSFGSTPAPIR